jgi:hypothetical protein
MIRVSNSLYLPPADEIKNLDDVRNYIQKLNTILQENQQNSYEDTKERIDKTSPETITGQKTFSKLALSANMNCNGFQLQSMVIENRESDPANPVEGQMWLRTDLL